MALGKEKTKTRFLGTVKKKSQMTQTRTRTKAGSKICKNQE